MKLIIGLGNPGKEYEKTRHNAGFLAIDGFAKSNKANWKIDKSLRAEMAKITINDQQVILAKPTTFMNLSGEAIQAIASYYKVGIGDILVIQDEMDLAPGLMAFKLGGGAAGHNGITSVTQHLGTQDYARLRIGIGRPIEQIPTEKWVLGKLAQETETQIEKTPDAIHDWITLGLAKAMNKWN
jgi:PTH1 family peptidyl-tRNA hydrolase